MRLKQHNFTIDGRNIAIWGGMTALLVIFCITMIIGIKSPTVAEAANNVSANNSTLDTKDQTLMINNTDRNNAYVLLIEHMNSLQSMYDLSDAAKQRLEAAFYEANVYIANTSMTVGQLNSYITTAKENMSAAIGDAALLTKTSSFLFLCNEVPTASAKYGQATTLTISLINLGKEGVTNVVVTPKISNSSTEWPFVITNASDVRTIASIPATNDVETAYAIRQNLSWNYTVSNEAKTGTYPIKFHVQYYRNGGNIEETDLTTYVKIQGKSENGTLDGTSSASENVASTPRIISTGFTTDPKDVYAGDTFQLTITVQNTSKETAVSNIQFDLKAAQTGSGSDNSNNSTYEAFLPTSGSATIYVDSIAPGASKDISIEMTARSDLSQKPYVITLDAAYEDKDHHPYTASTNISIPVHQIAKVDTGDAEVLPESVAVGSSSDVMFSIYNMGKTTLYNVQVSYKDDFVSGGNVFLGKIDPEGTGNVDAMVEAVALPEDGSDTITAVISYEDEAGNVTSFEKEIPFSIYEEDYSDMDYDDMAYEDEEVSQGLPVAAILGIIAGVIAVIVVIILVVHAKKKRKRLEEQRELDDLTDDE